MSLNIEEYLRYQRQMILPEIGKIGQEKIKNAKILCVGAGGLGCPSLQYLCAAGVGTLGIIDFDEIEIHNLHRQILYHDKDLGRSKAKTATERLKNLNPHTKTVCYNEKLTSENAQNIINQYDIILDGSDNFNTRFLVNDICKTLNKTLVYASILGFQGQLGVFHGESHLDLRDIFPEPPDDTDTPSCTENGVLGTVPGIMGIYMAHSALQIILGKYQYGWFYIINLWDISIKKLRLAN